ncbi:exocyst complex component exo84 [Geranomyces variabilis]|nr:exocyst complex component exo84 [Geranomyces variabilis]
MDTHGPGKLSLDVGSTSKRHVVAQSPNSTTSSTRTPLDIVRFADENFKAEQYVHAMLNQSTEDAVRAFHLDLLNARDAAAVDLQRNVYKNYTEFVLISKEIYKLETDMWELRGLLGEFKQVNLDLLRIGNVEDGAAALEKVSEDTYSQDALHTKALNTPSSNLATQSETQNRLSQLSALYETIEGLSKILPPTPTRYLIRDGSSTRYSEINPSNLNKVVQNVHFFLLSDALLVTTKKRGIISGKSRMVLDKCWSVGDVAIIDVKDSTEVSNAFKVLRHPDTFIYRSETLEEKRTFLTTFKRYTDELMLQKRAAVENAKSKQAAASNPLPAEDLLSPSRSDADREERARKAARDDLTGSDVKWLTELGDELDVLVAHRDFDVAVGLIEEARKLLAKATAETPRVSTMRGNVEERTNHLAQLVSMDLANPVASKKQVQANIDKLLRLGMGDQARDFFLTSRTSIIRHRIRLVRFDGDVAIYISELAQVVFRLIRNTCEWYGGSFRDTTMASGFMKWVNGELDNFAQIFRRQVFDCHPALSVIADCLQHAMHHCKPLREFGLHIAPILTFTLQPDIETAIAEQAADCVQSIVLAVEQDRWTIVDPKWLEGKEDEHADITAQVSKSVYQLYTVLMEFGSDVSVLMSIALYTKIVTCLTDFFSTYVARLCLTFIELSHGWTYAQRGVMLVDATFVVDELMPKVAGQLARRFDRAIPELEDTQGLLQHKVIQMRDVHFVNIVRDSLMKDVWNFPTIDYTSNGGILDTAKPSEHVMRLIEELDRLQGALSPTLPRQNILTTIVDQIFEAMNAPASWTTPRGTPRRLGFHGVQQLILDIHFFLRMVEPLISDAASDAANLICEKALRTFFNVQAGGAVVKAALKSGDWYDSRVNEVMGLISKEFPNLLALQAPPG